MNQALIHYKIVLSILLLKLTINVESCVLAISGANHQRTCNQSIPKDLYFKIVLKNIKKMLSLDGCYTVCYTVGGFSMGLGSYLGGVRHLTVLMHGC